MRKASNDLAERFRKVGAIEKAHESVTVLCLKMWRCSRYLKRVKDHVGMPYLQTLGYGYKGTLRFALSANMHKAILKLEKRTIKKFSKQN